MVKGHGSSVGDDKQYEGLETSSAGLEPKQAKAGRKGGGSPG